MINKGFCIMLVIVLQAYLSCTWEAIIIMGCSNVEHPCLTCYCEIVNTVRKQLLLGTKPKHWTEMKGPTISVICMILFWQGILMWSSEQKKGDTIILMKNIFFKNIYTNMPIQVSLFWFCKKNSYLLNIGKLGLAL